MGTRFPEVRMVGPIVDSSWQEVALGLLTDHSYLLMLVPKSKAPMSGLNEAKDLGESTRSGCNTR